MQKVILECKDSVVTFAELIGFTTSKYLYLRRSYETRYFKVKRSDTDIDPDINFSSIYQSKGFEYRQLVYKCQPLAFEDDVLMIQIDSAFISRNVDKVWKLYEAEF